MPLNQLERQPDLMVCRFLPDTTLTYVNPAYAQFFGKQEVELLGSRWIDFLEPSAKETALQHLATLTPERPASQYSHETAKANGERYWHLWHDYAMFDEAGNATELQSVGVDITEQKRAEARMEQFNALLLTLGKDFKRDVARLTQCFGEMLQADTALYNRLENGGLHSIGLYQPPPGYDPVKQLKGQICEHLLARPEERHTILQHLSQSTFAETNPDVLAFGFETYIGRPVFCRGEAVGVLCALYHGHRELSSHDDHTIALLAYALGELEERALAQEEQSQLQAELELKRNIESVGRLAGSIAHDFNNQLTVISGMAQLIQMNPTDSASVEENAADILKAARRSAQLTNRLLSFALRQPVAPVSLNLNASIRSMLPMLQEASNKGTLHWNAGDDLWFVKLDPTHLDQILSNLLENAFDAIGAGGHVRLSTSNAVVKEGGPDQPVDLAPGEYVYIDVKDDGVGMAPDIRARIFEPFFSTKAGGIGTGLGLSAVYRIVKENHGAIAVESTPGQGSRFRVFLPRHSEAPVTSTSAPPPTLAAGQGERILLVEDEAAVLNLARRILERSGYEVIPANGPSEALRLASESRERIDLLLTDVMMPEMNGPTLTERLLANDPNLKYLFMSGFSTDVVDRIGPLGGSVRLLRKPFSVESLTGAVRDALKPAD